MLRADDRGEQNDAAGDRRRHEVTCARLGEEHAPRLFTASGVIPVLRRQLQKRRRREHAGGAHEDVEPAVAPNDIADERLEPCDVGEIRRVRRGGRLRAARPPSPGRRPGQIDTRDLGPGPDECLGACEADAALRARDEGHAPVEPPRVEGGLQLTRAR